MTKLEELLAESEFDPKQRMFDLQASEDMELIQNLVNLRLHLGISQSELAALIGVSQPTIAKFESNDQDPRISTISRYALALGAVVHHRVSIDSAKVPPQSRQ